MHFIGQVIKHLLWSIFSIIVFLLLVGLAKMDRKIGAYIGFLNNESWSVINLSQPDTWVHPFWADHQISGNIADIFTEDILTGEESSGLDVYDPALEADLNTIIDSSLSGSEEDFGFTASGETVPSDTPSSTTTQILKQRALTK